MKRPTLPKPVAVTGPVGSATLEGSLIQGKQSTRLLWNGVSRTQGTK
jgi:hypothetical protein